MIPTIAEKKKVQQSQRSQRSYGSHSPAIAAITIAEIELFLSQRSLPVRSLNSGFHIIAAIANFFFFFFLSDRSDRSDHMETQCKTSNNCLYTVAQNGAQSLLLLLFFNNRKNKCLTSLPVFLFLSRSIVICCYSLHPCSEQLYQDCVLKSVIAKYFEILIFRSALLFL